MNRQIEFEHLNLSKWIPDEELKNFKSTVNHARDTLVKRDGAGNDFTGWLNHPVAYDKEEFERILQAAEEIRQNSDVLFLRKLEFLKISGRLGRYAGRMRLLCQCDFQIRNDHRVGSGFSYY